MHANTLLVVDLIRNVFCIAGNRIQEALSGTGVTAKTTNYTYNATNQLTNDGTHTLTYDANGNLTSDGTNTYTWDRANRMLTAPNNTSYTYDGLGNRTQQTTNRVVTDYLLDLQPGLVKVLRQSDGTATDHFIHAPRGIHAMQDNTGNWQYITQDGLGSVRSLINSTLGVDTTHSYDPYGNYIGTAPTDSYFGFTGERTDANGQLYLRARYYNPALAIFPSLDPFEGVASRPMSLNSYSWVEGNVPNATDPSGYAPSLSCWVSALSCMGSIAFVPDNAVGIGFVVDAASCGLGVAACGEELLLEIVETGLGRDAAEFLEGILGNGSDDTGYLSDYNGGWCEAPLPLASSNSQSTIGSQSNTQEGSGTENSDGFDLAFGRDVFVIPFAASFATQGERPALAWLDWPDWMITNSDGNMIPIMQREVFIGTFDAIMVGYFAVVPDGRMKFVLSGMDNTQPNSITTWELRKISTEYAEKADYYLFEGGVRTELSPELASARIAEILS